MLKEKLPEMELNGETHLQDGRRYSNDKVGTGPSQALSGTPMLLSLADRKIIQDMFTVTSA